MPTETTDFHRRKSLVVELKVEKARACEWFGRAGKISLKLELQSFFDCRSFREVVVKYGYATKGLEDTLKMLMEKRNGFINWECVDNRRRRDSEWVMS